MKQQVYYVLMRYFFVFAFFLIVLLVSGSLFLLVPPNTYLSQINISFWPKFVLRGFLEDKNLENIDIVVEGKTKVIKYADLGMSLNVTETMKSVATINVSRTLNRWIFPSDITMVYPKFEFYEDFEAKVSELFPERNTVNERVVYDKDKGRLAYLAEERKARIDSVDLQVKLVTFNEDAEPITVGMINKTNDLEKKVGEVNRNLAAVSEQPLEIFYKDNGRNIGINTDQIINLLEVETDEALENVYIEVDPEKVSELLISNDLADTSTDWTTKLIRDSLKARYQGKMGEPLVLGIDSGPNTDGSIADKYIEVDLSQQKMFFFENGSLFNAYSVSTGLNYPTPAGSYKIKNKLEIGFSNIFQVWMPWWMAFDYREDIGAYLGIHELPYRLDDGKKVYRFGNYIGNRKTGGCIALAPGDSKEVYDKSFPGMDLVVYQ